MQNLGGKQSVLWAIGKYRITETKLNFIYFVIVIFANECNFT